MTNQITQSSLLPSRRDTALTVGKTYVGIDFGTTTTVVSIASYDQSSNKIYTKAIRLNQKLIDGTMSSAEIIPTVIAWLATPQRILVGEGASELKYKLKKGKNVWFSFKMELGEDLGEKYYESELRDVEPFFIRNPKDCARVFFAYLKYLILRYCEENGLSKDISYAVSIPASFEANQRKDLLDALMANDISVSKQALIDEPNAAFISYVVTRASDGEPMYINPDYNSKVLVFDFGGGTCDISPIESAIKKSRTPKEGIDYVLFIGGSSQSPYIQEALNNYFEDSELLVPMNLQTHVSQGAAIHSLLLNGMNKCVIQPITSEPIIVITKDTQPKIILPAGTQIPCNTVAIEDLVTSRQGQKTIELPVCVGSVEKMLFNLKIQSPTDSGFPVNTPIQMYLEVNADKMLIAHATCMGVTCDVDPVNPFANKELTTEERIALKAERQANIESAQNNGVPSKETLEALRRAYEKAGNSFKAAETYELQLELYPNSVSLNSLGVLYGNAGASEKAIEYYEQAIQNNPNDAYANANLAHQILNSNPQRAKSLLNKSLEIDPEHDTALMNLGKICKSEGRMEDAKANFRKAYDIYKRQWDTDTLPKYAYGWFASAAEELGEKDFAKKIRQSTPKVEGEVYYDPDNLSQTQSNKLSQNN